MGDVLKMSDYPRKVTVAKPAVTAAVPADPKQSLAFWEGAMLGEPVELAEWTAMNFVVAFPAPSEGSSE